MAWEAHTAGKEGKPKTSTAGGSIREAAPQCLTAYPIILGTRQSVVPQTKPVLEEQPGMQLSNYPSGMIMRYQFQPRHTDLC